MSLRLVNPTLDGGVLGEAAGASAHARAGRAGRSRRLVARTVPVASLDAATRAAAFELFRQSYAGACLARFARDLDEKQLMILLFDRDSGGLKGFSTVHVHAKGARTIVFSGDTVVDREYWGQKRLQTAFAQLLLKLKLRTPRRPLHWFLISKGWRTYLLLANGFGKAIPRYDRPDDPALRAVLDEIAQARFGCDYDPATSLIRYSTEHERVREGLAPVPEALRQHPHVRFFLDRNPGHEQGEELACLAEVRLVDLAFIGARLATAIVRQALRIPARR